MPSWLRLSAVSAALACAALASTGFAQARAASGNPARGKILSQTCLGCHGIDGYRNAYPNYEVPRLWGQSPTYIVNALKEYKTGTQRTFVTMHAQASSLTVQDMKDIASYFGSHPLNKQPQPASAPKPPAAVGVCVACHGANGIGVAPMYPDLAGQHPDYIVQALKEYRDGERTNPIMAGMAKTLNLRKMWIVADYYASLKPSLKTLPRPDFFFTADR